MINFLGCSAQGQHRGVRNGHEHASKAAARFGLERRMRDITPTIDAYLSGGQA